MSLRDKHQFYRVHFLHIFFYQYLFRAIYRAFYFSYTFGRYMSLLLNALNHCSVTTSCKVRKLGSLHEPFSSWVYWKPGVINWGYCIHFSANGNSFTFDMEHHWVHARGYGYIFNTVRFRDQLLNHFSLISCNKSRKPCRPLSRYTVGTLRC